jgi:hypothetical protein
MELIEMIAWVVIGFGPMFGALEIASKKLVNVDRITLKIDVRGGDIWLAYDIGKDALRQLLLLGKYGGRITRVPEKIITLPSESYYFVEISSKEGTK